MNIKFHQVIDNIHGTIYYSKLESKIIGTPFFNRLHDVNQSSTVYLTFPPNRTKRYEHSLGVMQLTSDVFCNAIANSVGSDALSLLRKNADIEFKKILEYIKKSRGSNGFIFTFEQQTLSVLDRIKGKKQSEIEKIIEDEFLNVFEENCLLNLIPRYSQKGYDTFLFMALLQALRLVGLLHDVGHPPQSHIIESVLGDIYDDVQKIPEKDRTQRQNSFLEILSSYQNIEDDSILQIDQRMAIKTDNRKQEHLHEMIGLQIVKCIIDSTFPQIIEKNVSANKTEKDMVNALYYFTVIEFIFAIIRNKNAYWIGLHSIVDGTIDTDRLDFVPRDSGNTGMPWGKVEYKRLINTVKLGIIPNPMNQEQIRVCFSHKNIHQMDALLNDRYRIFTLINYHHRSTKYAALYQRATKILAWEYLKSKEPDSNEKSYFSDISGLWRTIEIVYAQDSSVLNIIQWNDSWLNGLLYRHLVEECSQMSGSTEMKECCECLKEIFLNKKKHFSLIKRKTELDEINNIVRESSKSLLDTIRLELMEIQVQIDEGEQKKCMSPYDKKLEKKLKAKKEAYDFLAEIHDAISKMNWTGIELKLGHNLISNSVKNVMSSHKDIIQSYMLEKVKFSLGLGETYVYDYDGNPQTYVECSNIKESLERARLSFPFFYIYLSFVEGKHEEYNNEFLCDLRKEIGKNIADKITKSVEHLINFEIRKIKKA